MAAKKKRTRKPPTPPIELIVRRGALRRFDKLKQATKTLPVNVIWDRRTAGSNTAKPDGEPEPGFPERRQKTPFTWTAADFVVVEGRAKTRSRGRKRQS